MACSCRAKNNKVIISPLPVKVETKSSFVSVPKTAKRMSKQSIIQIVSYSPSSSLSNSISYDFSSTTGPTELCYNCIRKHLSVAYSLLQQGRSSMFLPALGQILCASLHLIDSNKGLYNTMRNRVLEAMRGNKHLLLEDVFSWIKNVQTFTDAAEPLQPTPMEQCLIGLMTAYGLLFIEVTYEDLNKNWATAQLVKGAIRKFHSDRDIEDYQNIRKIWKLIQSMTLYDRTYEDARYSLKQQIQTEWKKYKAMNIIV